MRIYRRRFSVLIFAILVGLGTPPVAAQVPLESEEHLVGTWKIDDKTVITFTLEPSAQVEDAYRAYFYNRKGERTEGAWRQARFIDKETFGVRMIQIGSAQHGLGGKYRIKYLGDEITVNTGSGSYRPMVKTDPPQAPQG